MNKSLALGQTAELFVHALLKLADIENKIISKDEVFEDYDILGQIDNRPFTIEVKYDLMYSKTGNIAIEYYNSKSNKPSGINVTKADIWCEVLAENNELSAWICPTNSLMRYIKDNPCDRMLEGVGDNNADIMLYKGNKLLLEFVRIDTKNMLELKDIIRKML